MLRYILQERIRNNSKEVDTFRSIVDARSVEYVDEILSPHFGGVIQYVKEGETLLERDMLDELKKQEGRYFLSKKLLNTSSDYEYELFR